MSKENQILAKVCKIGDLVKLPLEEEELMRLGLLYEWRVLSIKGDQVALVCSNYPAQFSPLINKGYLQEKFSMEDFFEYISKVRNKEVYFYEGTEGRYKKLKLNNEKYIVGYKLALTMEEYNIIKEYVKFKDEVRYFIAQREGELIQTVQDKSLQWVNYEYDANLTPVVYLRYNIETSGKSENGRWWNLVEDTGELKIGVEKIKETAKIIAEEVINKAAVYKDSAPDVLDTIKKKAKEMKDNESIINFADKTKTSFKIGYNYIKNKTAKFFTTEELDKEETCVNEDNKNVQEDETTLNEFVEEMTSYSEDE